MSLVFFSSPARAGARGCEGVTGASTSRTARRHAGPRGDARAHRVARHHVPEQHGAVGEALEAVRVLSQVEHRRRRCVDHHVGGRGRHLERPRLQAGRRERSPSATLQSAAAIASSRPRRRRSAGARGSGGAFAEDLDPPDQRRRAPRDLRAEVARRPTSFIWRHGAPRPTSASSSSLTTAATWRSPPCARPTPPSAAITAEWLVVDNGSSDGTADAIESRVLPTCACSARANRGFAAGNNVALPHATGRYVLLAQPRRRGRPTARSPSSSPRWTTAPRSAWRASASARPTGRCSRRSAASRRRRAARRGARRRPASPASPASRSSTRTSRATTEERSADWLVGAFLVARREAIDAGRSAGRGLLPLRRGDRLVPPLPARAAGTCGTCRSMTITHHEGDNKRPEMVAQLGHSRRRFAYKHFAWPRAVALHASLVLNHLLRLAVVRAAAALRAAVAPTRAAPRRPGSRSCAGRRRPTVRKIASPRPLSIPTWMNRRSNCERFRQRCS